jgi:hypothetical protein
MAGAGVLVALALTITFAGSASADTLFTGYSGNAASNASLYYQYDTCDSAGYCHIKVTETEVADNPKWCWDGWGSVLVMHYKTRSSSNEQQRDLTKAGDCDYNFGGPIDSSGYKGVWFEVCNWNPSTDQRYTCGRLHKFPE